MRYIFLAIITSFVYNSHAQNYDFEKSYTPIKFEGKIPDEFLSDVTEVTKAELKKEKELSKSGAKEFYTETNFAQKSLMSSGIVYFNDPLSEMVNKIASKLLEQLDDKSLTNNLRFYVTKFDVPNATCWRNGYIYFNLGLLRDLENEAQIAFILCHEIIHYQEQHSFNYYKKTTDLSKKEKKAEKKRQKELSDVVDKEEDKFLRDMKYSRENETEADIKGFELYTKTKYDINEAVNALKVLATYRETPEYFIPSDLFALFDSEGYELDTSDLYEDEIMDTVFIEAKEIDTDSLEFYSTHPDIIKRIEALEEKIEAMNVKDNNGVKFQYYKNNWEDYKTMMDFEFISFYDEVGAYNSLFYKTYKMLQDYPENEYLITQHAKSLFWLGVYADSREIYRLGKREVFNDKNYVLYTLGKVLRDKGFIQSQFETMEKKYPNSEAVKVYSLRYDEVVKNKRNSKEYKELSGSNDEFSNFIKYKSKGR
ncbi:MAG: M48 family metallopeptidase [Bacteroidetes bacterium]|nr:M48 family metallopeptidase [Bacteroidota bacterium]